MIPPDTISIAFLARQQAQLLEEVRATRAESREVRRSFTLISDHFSRQERRIGELRDDIETMVKLELGGTIANLETRLETYVDSRFAALEARIDGVDVRLGGVEARLGGVEARLGGVEARLGGVEARLGGMDHQLAGQGSKLDAILAALRPD